MSKRSGLSRLEDLKRHFIDIGRYRYILHKFDMETWRDKICPICSRGFTGEPNFSYESISIHWDCFDSDEGQDWVNKHNDEYHSDEGGYMSPAHPNDPYSFSIPHLPEGTDTDDLP